jgi:hypothetical protein
MEFYIIDIFIHATYTFSDSVLPTGGWARLLRRPLVPPVMAESAWLIMSSADTAEAAAHYFRQP